MSQRATGARSGGRTPFSVLKGILSTVGSILATFIMVSIITGCIVACVMTVYILRYIGAEETIDLDSVKLGYTSIVYATDAETGEDEILARLYFGGQDRIWIDYDRINQYTKDAIVAIEDKRFWEHDGVDWKRTTGAFVNQFVPIYSTQAGGSTITQQLIKNVTGDNDFRIERKVREIFRALNLSKRYSRERILESYLNVVPLGNGTNGIQAAANLYFDKDAADLTLAESAAIVGITQFPGRYDPFVNPEKNKERQEHILSEMLDQGKITQKEHDDAVAEVLEFKGDKHFTEISKTQSYFVDHVINEVIDDLMTQKGYTRAYATEQVYQAGYRIYTTVDTDLQTHLETIYSDVANFPAIYNTEYPQSASIITDLNGKILAMVGGIGEKEGARILNRATMSRRQPGSSIKPLAAYAMAFEYDRVTWSTMIEDSPILMNEAGKTPYEWPSNYYNGYDGMMTVDTAIQRSTNTVAAKLTISITPERIFNFLHNDLNFYSLVERETINGQVASDVLPSPMALGALTYGVTPMEMAGGYQIFGNGGLFTSPYSYTKVLDSAGRTILEKDTTPRRVLSEDTAVVLNKLLQRVTTGPRGTGTAANLGNMPTAGKTGTSQEDVDQWFIGLTPYYVCQVWLGYDEPRVMKVNQTTGREQWVVNSIRYGSYPPPILWKTIMKPIHDNLEYQQFVDSPTVVSKEYCLSSGDLATPLCAATGTGWYKTSRIPGSCTKCASAAAHEEENQIDVGNDDERDSDDSPGLWASIPEEDDDDDFSFHD